LGLLVLLPLAVLLTAGCGKSKQPSLPLAQPPPSKVVLAIHWIGKARLAQDTNAAYQIELWNLPESVRLEEQTLDKLARALPKLLGIPNGGDTNALTGVIRPLLDDLVQAESFTEVRITGNQAMEFALAIRPSPERLALWQTNVATVIQVLNDRSRPEQVASPKTLQFSGADDWILIGFRRSEPAASAVPSTPPESLPPPDQNALFTQFVHRFESANPLAGDTSNLTPQPRSS
jgi:hypothetical protein